MVTIYNRHALILKEIDADYSITAKKRRKKQ